MNNILAQRRQTLLALKALRSATGFIRHALGQRVILRSIPELSFVFDDSIAYSVHISSLLREIAGEDKKDGEDT